MRSLLITGASGFLGSHLCHHQLPHWQMWGTYHTQAIAYPHVTMLPLDITDEQSIQACWDQSNPDAVIHTAALSKAGECQHHPNLSYHINVNGSLHLAKRCAEADIPFLYTSTDLVFDGTTPPYRESDRPHPINVYGEHKAKAERQILEQYPRATICRLPLLMGAATPTATCFVQSTLAGIATNAPQTLFTDEIRTPVSVADVILGLRLVLEQGVTGILHLGGRDRINRYELGLLIAESFGVSADALLPGLQASVALATPRPKDVSLNSQKAFALGYSPQPVRTALNKIAHE